MSEPRTIDAITHALPHPELRARFMREVNLTDIDQLPDVIARWQRFVEKWEAGKPERDALIAYVREHGVEPPHLRATNEAVADSDTFLERLQADVDSRHQGSSAA